jgi:AhpD family alkylhydroperoxidase
MEKTKAKASDMAAGFGGMFSKIMADGAVTLREKELVALGIAVAAKCEPCIFAHVKKCLDAGNSPEQIIDAASVAVMMGGGPAFMHMTAVFDALEALGK